MFIEPLAIPTGARLLDVLPRLALALEGGHPIAPYAVGSPPPVLPPHADADLPGDLAVVVGTSGSTGAPKLAMLTTGNLRSSIAATAARTGGHGQWLVTLPGHHIAGLQVLLRSIVAGSTPHVMDTSNGFTPQAWCAAVDAMSPTDDPTHVSIVPTQLVRLLADVEATARLCRFTSVLVGGSATQPELLNRALGAGVNTLTTYGMSETAGGCVYSGQPLDGTTVTFEAINSVGDAAPAMVTGSVLSAGRIILTGPTVAHGYLGDPHRTATHFPLIASSADPNRTAPNFPLIASSADRERSERSAELAISGETRPASTHPASAREAEVQRVFLTDDVGHFDGEGRLHVDGRIDDLITTGGLKVAPRLVEEAITRLDGIAEAVAVGIPDREWGEVVAVAIVTDPRHPKSRTPGPPRTVSEMRSRLDGILDGHALPRAVLEVDALPTKGPGKPDRAAVRALFDTVGE